MFGIFEAAGTTTLENLQRFESGTLYAIQVCALSLSIYFAALSLAN